MKIVYVSDSIYPYHKGGKEKRLYELSTRLAQLGHNVHIYTMHWWDTPEQTRIENGVHLHAISKFYPMYKGDRRSIKEGLLFGLACFKLFKVKFDVLDVDHMPYFPIYSAWIVCKLRGKKLHGTWHEALSRKDWTNYMGKAGHISYLIEHISIKLPYHITAVSTHTQSTLHTLHKRNHRLSLVTPGIDTTLLHKLLPANIRCDVLYIGRLVKDKNVDKLIYAIDLLKQSMPDVKCMIVGHGIEKKRLEKLVANLHLQNNITIRGPLQNDTDVYAYMKAAKVFCLPSIREGFGMVALESLGCGTPVITTDAPANAAKHLVKEGVNGSIVHSKSALIANAILHWANMLKPKHVSKKVASYDWNKLAEKQAEVYVL